MKILLLGEYSRLHNSLKEGLQLIGHEVILIGTGDAFKKYPVNYSVEATWSQSNIFGQLISKLLIKLRVLNINKIERAIRLYALISKLNDFDHVQLINSDAIETYPVLSRLLYKKIFKKIKNRSLLICGDETPVIDYLLKNELKYSILTPYLNDNSLVKGFHFPLKYQQNNYRKTFNWLTQNCQNIITSDLDYEIPMQKMGYTTTFIPNPINTEILKYSPIEIKDKIVFFLGINRGSYTKKGITFFEKALEIIKAKYPEKVTIVVSENLPYNEYLQKYNEAHILLDQVYAYDQGYNALEAMTKGKVVFTGAENEFLAHYDLVEDEVCINALPNENDIAKKLSFLIENPEKIIEISNKARNFIEKEHHYKTIAERYLTTWATNSFL